MVAIDFNLGMRHCDEQAAIYHAVLTQFQHQYQQGLDSQLLQQLTEESLRELHTLKGLCATIGATELSEQARQNYNEWADLSSAQRLQQTARLNQQLSLINDKIDEYLVNLIRKK